MDASVMDGRELLNGAVAGLTTTRNPVLAARYVMEHSEHVFFQGAGANKISIEAGLQQEDPEYFKTEARWNALQKAIERAQAAVSRRLPHLNSVDSSCCFRGGVSNRLDWLCGPHRRRLRRRSKRLTLTAAP
jgi:isoaspartyl peptidase/L-asparaginase-like protein (Ntn-hydrolase superfamily)